MQRVRTANGDETQTAIVLLLSPGDHFGGLPTQALCPLVIPECVNRRVVLPLTAPTPPSPLSSTASAYEEDKLPKAPVVVLQADDLGASLLSRPELHVKRSSGLFDRILEKRPDTKASRRGRRDRKDAPSSLSRTTMVANENDSLSLGGTPQSKPKAVTTPYKRSSSGHRLRHSHVGGSGGSGGGGGAAPGSSGGGRWSGPAWGPRPDGGNGNGNTVGLEEKKDAAAGGSPMHPRSAGAANVAAETSASGRRRRRAVSAGNGTDGGWVCVGV